MTDKFIIYTKEACSQCDETKAFLKAHNADYSEVSLSDPVALAEVKMWGFKQAPVVIAPDGTKWSGFNESKLEDALGIDLWE